CLFDRVFFLMSCLSRSTLFPYTTLFRSFGRKGDDEYFALPRQFGDAHHRQNGCALDQHDVDAAHRLHDEAHGLRQNDQPQDLERSEEHTSELQSRENLVCRHLLEKKNRRKNVITMEKGSAPRHAAQTTAEKGMGCMRVVDGNKLASISISRDNARRSAQA